MEEKDLIFIVHINNKKYKTLIYHQLHTYNITVIRFVKLIITIKVSGKSIYYITEVCIIY